ncbi:MAG: DUF4911 domain-containing protein [Desulfitobacterium hafniense]|nr:DUF4911 domain-containing protein [Desulfitobacterium hafniense]
MSLSNLEDIGKISRSENSGTKALTELPDFSEADFIVRAKVPRSEIQMLVKLVEGFSHFGVVTTTNKEAGEVIIQTTKYCWPELEPAIKHMPFVVEFLP